MDNNNMYGQGNQNMEQGQPQPPQQQPYQQQAPNQNYGQQPYQPYQQQQPYQQTYQQSYQPDSDLEDPVSFGDWMLSMLLMMLPCVNIIMMFVWAFGSGTKKSKSNYFKAVLVWTLIWFVISIIILIGFSSMMATLYGSYY